MLCPQNGPVISSYLLTKNPQCFCSCGALHVGDHVLSADGMSFTDGPGLAVSEATKLVTANAGSQIQLEVVPAALVRDETEPVPASSAPSVAEQKSPEPPAPAPGMLENAALWSKSMRFVFSGFFLLNGHILL